MIRAETEGEIVDIIDRGPYTLVRKYPTSRDSSTTYPQPLSLYRVKREKRLNGEQRLHWSFLGDVIEPPSVACGNCGVLLEESTTVCPHCGEELSRNEEV
jgi:rubrerythrin